MKNYADLKSCYPPQPWALVGNSHLDLHNFSHGLMQWLLINRPSNPWTMQIWSVWKKAPKNLEISDLEPGDFENMY